jgi:hypothetical protein
MARGVLRGTPLAKDTQAADDLVAVFLLRLVEATAAGKAGSIHKLLELNDARLRAAIRHRLVQVAAEESPRWGLVKGLREHVAHALAQVSLEAPAAVPSTLMVEGR